MTHSIVSRTKWIAARKAHLADEKAFTRARDALGARRRALPWMLVEQPYRFDTPDGPATLADLFGPHSQLIVQHFMFGPDWQAGCPSCSFWADGYDRMVVHLAHRDAALVTVSNTALDKITAYRARMGWSFPWVSSLGTNFSRDFGVTFSPEDLATGAQTYNYGTTSPPATESPGITVFRKLDDGRVVQTYGAFGRGLDMMNAAYHYMDLLPKGRDEADGIMAWLRRRDEYDT